MDFGDIFTFNEKQYVYLGEHFAQTHAAEIRSPEVSQLLRDKRSDTFKNGYTEDLIAQSMQPYQFVILKTEQYKNQAASIGHEHDSRSAFIHEDGDALVAQDILDLCKIIEKTKTIITPIKALAAQVAAALEQSLVAEAALFKTFDESQAGY